MSIHDLAQLPYSLNSEYYRVIEKLVETRIMFKQTKVLAIVLPALLATGGCASQGALESLQQDVDTLSDQVEQAKIDSAQALRISQNLQQSLDAVQQSADSARDDASSTRILLEQMDARLNQQSGSQSLK